MRTVDVSVTAEHIASGVKGDCGKCPIALAVADILPNGPSFEVDAECLAYWYPNGSGHVVRLPRGAENFIWRFDQGLPVEPFTFTIQVPEAVAAR